MRRGFTLIELLVTITIIGILASLVLTSVTWARNRAREDRTRGLVAKLNQVLYWEWERLRSQRLPSTIPDEAYKPHPVTGELVLDREWLRKWRGNARRDLIRMELPDRWSDVTGPALVLPERTARATQWRRLYLQALGPDPDEDTIQRVNAWESSELLYLIVRNSGRNLDVPDWHIGDFDGDGLREYWDAWGLPIAFVRWPAPPHGTAAQGISDPVSTETGLVKSGADDAEIVMGPYPLILSAGRDGIFDVNRGTMEEDGESVTYRYRLDEYDNLNPWTVDEHDPPYRIGEAVDGTAPDGSPPDGHLGTFDNITNRNLQRPL